MLECELKKKFFLDSFEPLAQAPEFLIVKFSIGATKKPFHVMKRALREPTKSRFTPIMATVNSW